jgi:serine/threonine protein kinase
LQEVLYRALERDPKNRYAMRTNFKHDLEHMDQVGVEDRPELRDWQKRKSHCSRKYSLLRRSGHDSRGDPAADVPRRPPSLTRIKICNRSSNLYEILMSKALRFACISIPFPAKGDP